MSQSQRVALVTGANQGIGQSIVKLMLQRDKDLRVLLGSRTISNGHKAVEEIVKQVGGDSKQRLEAISIDITKPETVGAAAKYVKETYDGLDILVNNAGWASKGSAISEQICADTYKVNYYGTKTVIDTFLPIVRTPGRVINVSSTSAAYAFRDMSEEHRKQLLDDNLTVEQLEKLLNDFLHSVKDEKMKDEGWPKSCYGMSKVGVSMLTKIYAKQYNDKGITFNAGCPGYVKTNMSSYSKDASREPDEGAETFVHLALSEDGGKVTGRFWYDSKPVEWTTVNM